MFSHATVSSDQSLSLDNNDVTADAEVADPCEANKPRHLFAPQVVNPVL